MLYYKLGTPIPAEKLLQDIQNLLSKHPGENKVMIIKIEDITDYAGDSPLLKLPHYDPN